jgi:hypothetical protein
MLQIAAIDYSLTCPCICVHVGDTWEYDNCLFYYLTHVKKFQGSFASKIYGESFDDYDGDSERHDTLSEWAMDCLNDCDQIAIEGYSYGSTGQAIFQIAENTGLLKYKIFKKKIPLTIYPPTEIKKFATGKGNADKGRMYTHFFEETGVDLIRLLAYKKEEISSPISDIVDSYWICKNLFYDIKTNPVSA